VFECESQAPEDLIILALQQAVVDKVDIINLSLGVPTYWEGDDPFVATTSNLEARGIAVVVSNGNSYVPGLPSSRKSLIKIHDVLTDVRVAGTNKGVIAVGSAQNNYFPTVYSIRDSRGRSLKYGGQAWPIEAPVTGLRVASFRKLAVSSQVPGPCDYESWEAVNTAVTDKENTILAIPHDKQCAWNLVLRLSEEFGFKYSLMYAVDDSDIYDKDFNVIYNLPGFYCKSMSNHLIQC
jgi:hypothetical protein